MVLLTFKQSRKQSTISQFFVVAAASGGPKDLRTAATDALNTCAAKFTRILEKALRFMWSHVNFGRSFSPLSASWSNICALCCHGTNFPSFLMYLEHLPLPEWKRQFMAVFIKWGASEKK